MEPARRKALGRGLGALIPAASRQPEEGEAAAAVEIPVESVVPNRLQPRQDFNEESLAQLVSSIEQNGVLQPILVRRIANGFELIAGERRFRGAQRAGLRTIPAVIKEADDRSALELALVENLQREDLNPIDEASGYARLLDEFHLTQEHVAAKVGKSRPAVANCLRLLDLPAAVQAEIRAGHLSQGHARAIAGAATAADQTMIAREVLRRRMTVRDTERLVRDLRRKGSPDPERAAVEDRLRRALGTKVRVLPRASGGGRIEITYHSLEELQGLIDRLVS